MLILALPVLLGLAIGMAAGGRLDRWGRAHIDGWLFAAGGLGLQVALFDPPLDASTWAQAHGPVLYLMSLLLIAGVLIWNGREHGRNSGGLALVVAAIGVLLNCLVITANGGYMPRAAVSGHPPVSEPAQAGRLVNVTPMTDDTRLAWLGDVLPEPTWLPLSNVLSVGDALLSAGLGAWAFAVTTGTGRARRRAHVATG
jgi:hypothetical protein